MVFELLDGRPGLARVVDGVRMKLRMKAREDDYAAVLARGRPPRSRGFRDVC